MASWQWSYLSPNVTLEGRIERLKRHLCEELIPSTFIAKNAVLLGSATIVSYDIDTRTDLSPRLANVFVASEHRNSGIGSKRVRYVMERAKETGLEMLYLFTPDRELFYRKLGWNLLSKDIYREHPVAVMQVKLN